MEFRARVAEYGALLGRSETLTLLAFGTVRGTVDHQAAHPDWMSAEKALAEIREVYAAEAIVRAEILGGAL